MSSLASRQYDHLRSRMSSVLLLAILVFAAPGALQSQRTTTVDSQPPQTKTTTRRVLRPQTTATAAVSQRRTTAPSAAPSAAPSTAAPPQPAAVPQDSTRRRTTPPRQTDTPAPRESTFVQRLLTAIANGLATKDTTSQPPGRKVQQPLMPNVVGMDTMTALARLGLSARSRSPLLTYVIVLPAPTLNPVDRIATQFPAANTPVSRGMNVRLTLAGVTRPPAFVTVPDLMGRLEAEAAETLRARGFVEDKVTKSVKASDSIGRVTGQNPRAGTRIAVGGVVAIAIGQGVRVIMPKVTNLTLATARQRLSAAGIDVARIRGASVRSTKPVGSVVRQLPEPGTVVLPTTRIVLTQAVPTPRPQPPRSQPPRLQPPTPKVARMVVMPLLVGRDSVTAKRTLSDAGLLNYEIRVPAKTTVLDTVRVQSPPSGRMIASTHRVVLTLGPPPIPFPPPGTWVVLLVVAYGLAVAVASALAAPRIWPPPQILTSVRLLSTFTDIVGLSGSLVDVSISLRSHVEHERSVLDLTGSPLE
jgi:beta-lactam-binding protein with PASTA domain